MSAKKYIFVFTAAFLILSGLTVVFDRVVDPFWYYRDVSIDGFNAVKPKFRNYARHVKPALVQREQPASLIFGSSFSEIGFDPLHPALLAAGKSYNFALAGSSWEMVACDVQFALLKDVALRQIVLGIHPGALPQINCKSEIAKMETPDQRAFLFSYDAFESSINTVLEQHKQKPSHTTEGLYFYARGVPATESRFREYFARYTPCKMNRVVTNPPDTATLTKQGDFDLRGLRELVRKTTERGIVLKLVVYPRHSLSIEQQYQCGTRQARWDALAQIVSVVEAAQSNLVEVWDFEGYHAIGTEKISDEPGVYWQDPEHFNSEMGNIMLDEMFGLKPAQLGMRMSFANISARAEVERKARMAYLAEHPEFLKQLETLLPGR